MCYITRECAVLRMNQTVLPYIQSGLLSSACKNATWRAHTWRDNSIRLKVISGLHECGCVISRIHEYYTIWHGALTWRMRHDGLRSDVTYSHETWLNRTYQAECTLRCWCLPVCTQKYIATHWTTLHHTAACIHAWAALSCWNLFIQTSTHTHCNTLHHIYAYTRT